MLGNPVSSFFSTRLSFFRLSGCQTSSTSIIMYVQKLLITIQNNLSRNPLSGCTEIFVLQFFSLLINPVIPFLSTWQIDCCSLRFVIEGLQIISLQLRYKSYGSTCPFQHFWFSNFWACSAILWLQELLKSGAFFAWRFVPLHVWRHMWPPRWIQPCLPRWNFPHHVGTQERGEALVGNWQEFPTLWCSNDLFLVAPK